MKISPRTLLVAAASLACLLVARAAPIVGQVAPDFALIDLNGQKQSLAAYKGRIVVLEWVNPECPFVQKHYQGSGNIPATQKLAQADGVVWLSINSGYPGSEGDFTPAEIAAWHKKTGAAPTAIAATRTARSAGSTTPGTRPRYLSSIPRARWSTPAVSMTSTRPTRPTSPARTIT